MKMTIDEAIKIVEGYRGIDLDVVDKVLPGFGGECKKIDEALGVLIDVVKKTTSVDMNDPFWFDCLSDVITIQAQAEVIANLDVWDIGEAFRRVVNKENNENMVAPVKAACAFFSYWLYERFAIVDEPDEKDEEEK